MLIAAHSYEYCVALRVTVKSVSKNNEDLALAEK
jgi:hypothetical protein